MTSKNGTTDTNRPSPKLSKVCTCIPKKRMFKIFNNDLQENQQKYVSKKYKQDNKSLKPAKTGLTFIMVMYSTISDPT